MRSPVGSLLLALCLFLGLASPPRAQAPEPAGEPVLRVATFDAPPLVFADGQGRLSGYAVDLLDALATHGRLRWEAAPQRTLGEALEALRAGEVDLVVPLGITPGRQRWLRFTEPVADLSVAVLAGPLSPGGSVDAVRLADRRVAVLDSSFILENLIELAPRARLVPQPTDREVLGRLALGEVDFAVVELSRAVHHIERLGLRNLRIAGDLPIRYRPAIASLVERTDLGARLDAAMAALPPEELRAIQSRWLTPLEDPWWKRPAGLALLAALVAALAALAWLRVKTRQGGEALAEARSMLDRTARVSQVGSWWLDVGARRLHWSAETLRIHGLDPAGPVPDPDAAIERFLPAWREPLREAALQCARDGRPFSLDAQLQDAEGRTRWVRVTGEPQPLSRRRRPAEGGLRHRVRGTFQDIDAQVRQAQALAHSERLYRTLADNLSDLITLQGADGRLRYVSPSARRLVGREPDALLGAELAALAHPEDAAALREAQAAALAGRAAPVLWRLARDDESLVWMESRMQCARSPEGDPELVTTSRDVTDRRNAEARMHYMAHHDELTRLPNRLGMLARVEEHMRTDPGGPLAMLYLDVDDFKNVNDTLGHDTGDALLTALAARLREQLPPPLFLARLSGDEFVALVPGRDALQRAEQTARRLMRLFDQPFETPDAGRVFLAASAGVALYPRDGRDADALLTAADTALVDAKRAGRNTWRVYEPALRAQLNEKAHAVQGVRTAFERGEFELWFQPKICLADRRVCGFEALLRRRTDSGIAPPGRLIEAAEESGFITTLGTWVVEATARQSRVWRAQGLEVPIAVNISFKQLQDPAFLPMVERLLAQDPELPRFLEIELTETAIALDAQQASHRLLALRRLGFRMHIDDFGTGYSSLSYVSQLPVDTLKIDQSFVRGLPHDQGSREVVRAVTALAGSLGLRVVAEGTENEDQAAFLAANGCDEAQGWLFARAMEPDDALRFVQEDRMRHGPPPRGPDSRPDGTPLH